MPKKLLFISSANLTTNPRLLKELKTAADLGYEADFTGFKLGNWSDATDAEIIKPLKANYHYIPVTRKPFLNWLTAGITEKAAQKLYPFFKKSLKINAYAHSRRAYLLNKHLKMTNKKYDLIIAHTLPTLYPAYKLAKRTNTKFTFDIEDYHPGEAVSSDAKHEPERRRFLMKRLLPKTAYITYASPLIGKHSLELCNNSLQNHSLINNCFSEKEFQYTENHSEKVKFVWFSQNIAAARGLELVLPALQKYKDKAELHLIGNLYPDFYDNYLSDYSHIITVHKPRPQTELNRMLAEFDVGLAVEPGKDFNNNIALSNKIWAYLQSGLYILATDTPAQRKFIETHPQAGKISKQNTEDFTENIAFIIKNLSENRKNKKDRFEYAQKYAWEKESAKLTEIWNNLTT